MSAFVRLLIVLIAIMGSAHANTCKFVSKTCIDTLQPKNVSGTNVFFSDVGIVDACWQWQSNYECVDNTSPTVVNYCAALESISQCRVTNSVCARTSPVNGTCEMYTKTFRCGDPVGGISNVVVLNNTYTLAQDTVNAQACNDYSSNASCKLSSETCTDGPSTKVLYPNGTSRLATPAEITAGTSVNGVVKYQACWKWNRDYSCLIGDYKNYCQPLVGAGCVESSAAVCRNTGWNGSCLEYDRTYNCGAKVDPPPSNVVYLNASYTITGETAPSTCGDPSSNPNCTKMGEPCIDGPATKVVLPTGATPVSYTHLEPTRPY